VKILRVPLSKISPWAKNPRGIKTEDFERLKKEIVDLDEYKPLVCVQEGDRYICLGGNMRLRAYRDLGFKEAWISIVEAKKEARRAAFAISDNDRAGYYETDALTELLDSIKEDIDLDLFKVDLGYPISLRTVLQGVSPDPPGGGADIGDQEEHFVEIYCSDEALKEIRPTINKWRKMEGIRIKVS